MPGLLEAESFGHSDLDKLHLSACQLNQITVFERYRINANGPTVESRVARALNMVNKETVVPFGNGRHCNAGLANGGDDLGQGHFTP